MNQAFSKIWIIVIVVVLVVGGIFAWQYWWAPKEEVGESYISESYIKVISPNGGESWVTNTTQIIRWETSSKIKTVRVLLWAAKESSYLKNPVSTALRSFVISQKEYAPRGYMRWNIDPEALGLDFTKDKYFSITIEGYSVAPEEMPAVGWGNYFVGLDSSDDYFNITEDETADWKNYINRKYNIKFKYPNSWILDDKEALSINLPDQTKNFIQINVSNGISGPEDESMSPCQPGIASMVYQVGKLRDSQQTFEEFVNFQIENPERGMPLAVKPELIPVTIGEHNALKTEDTIDNCKKEFYYVEQRSDRYMTISFIVEGDDDKLVIEKILSTFSFIE